MHNQISSTEQQVSAFRGGRDSNIELFRIIVMLFIVAHHLMGFSGYTVHMRELPLEPQSIYMHLFGMWGKTGINCFVMITGYFMCTSHITLKKIFKLLFQIEFYAILFYLIFCVSGYIGVNGQSFIQYINPFRDMRANFVSCFLFFYLLIPLLNKIIHRLTKKQHLIAAVSSVLLYQMSPSVCRSYIIWFPVIYMIASYIRLYPYINFRNTKLWGYISIFLVMLAMLSVVLRLVLALTPYYIFVADCEAPFAVLISISLFIYFSNLKIKYNKHINKIAATVFGVLLIHSNSQIMRDWLFHDFLNCDSWYYSSWLIPYTIFIVILIFSVCSLIDYLRIYYIEKPIMRFIFK